MLNDAWCCTLMTMILTMVVVGIVNGRHVRLPSVERFTQIEKRTANKQRAAFPMMRSCPL